MCSPATEADVNAWACKEVAKFDGAVVLPGDKTHIEISESPRDEQVSPHTDTASSVEMNNPTIVQNDGINIHLSPKEFEAEAGRLASQDHNKLQEILEASLTKQDLELRAAVQSGDFKIAGPLGQRFTRSNEAKSDSYKSLRSHNDKREFRMAWAKARHDEVFEKKITCANTSS